MLFLVSDAQLKLKQRIMDAKKNINLHNYISMAGVADGVANIKSLYITYGY